MQQPSGPDGDGDVDANVSVFTHPAVLEVFRTESILEEICSHLELQDLKQFRLVSSTCSSEGRRELMKRDGHWVVVKSESDGWQLELDSVLRSLETASGGNCSKKLLGWMFKRLELNDWKHSLGKSHFLRQWGHYLRKIHLKSDSCRNEDGDTVGTSHFVNTIHKLLSVCCPNLEEMVVMAVLSNGDLAPVSVKKLIDLTFPLPLLKLKCLRINYGSAGFFSMQEKKILSTFFTKLVLAAGIGLEKLDIGYSTSERDLEKKMLEVMAMTPDLNNGGVVNNFHSLKELTLTSASNIRILARKSFPGLTKLILGAFFSVPMLSSRADPDDPRNYRVYPESFPALKSLTIKFIRYEHFVIGRIVYFLQNFPKLETLNISAVSIDSALEVSDLIAPRLESLRSFAFKTEHYDLGLLRCIVKLFPNLVTLNLLEFGTGDDVTIREPEYSFGELIDTLSPLSRLQQLYVNHAFHTSPQLANAVELALNFSALDTLILSQIAHEDLEKDFNVSLYLTTSDPDFLSILNCDGVRRLKSVHLVDFRFGSTRKELEDEAAAKCGHVSFDFICSGYSEPWVCVNRNRLNKCQCQY